MKEQIVQVGDPVLRQKAKILLTADLASQRFAEVLAEMKKVLAAREDGVAIAAPQIGVSWRLFVVSPRVFEEMGQPTDLKAKHELVFVNPEIIRRSRKKTNLVEGCLSVNNVYGHTRRHEKVTLQALDEKGRKITYHASGLLAQIFQHETDHLEGILFIDHASDLEDLAKPENES